MKYLPLWCLRRHSLNAGKWCMGFHRTSSLCFCHPPFLATQFPHTSGMNLTHTHRQALQVNTTGLSFRDKDESFSFALFVANTSKNMLAIIHNVSHWVPLGVKKKRVSFLLVYQTCTEVTMYCVLYVRMKSYSHTSDSVFMFSHTFKYVQVQQ